MAGSARQTDWEDARWGRGYEARRGFPENNRYKTPDPSPFYRNFSTYKFLLPSVWTEAARRVSQGVSRLATVDVAAARPDQAESGSTSSWCEGILGSLVFV